MIERTALDWKLRRTEHTCNQMCVIVRGYEEHVDDDAKFIEVSWLDRLRFLLMELGW